MPRLDPRVLLPELATFDAGARHGSFSAAARELGLTQSAVSHQMAHLERSLGTALFRRVWRGVSLTEAGEALQEQVKAGLDLLAAGVAAARAAGGKQRLTVMTDFGFAAYWLLPRLDRLAGILPEVDVQILTTQSSGNVDLTAGDVAIAFGSAPPPRWTCMRLAREEVLPVASPTLAARLAGEPNGIRGIPLLHLAMPSEGRWLSWDDYLGRQSLPRQRDGATLTFNNYPLVLQAAIAGQGIALGWRPLVDDLLVQGLLVPVLPAEITETRGYDLLLPPGKAERPVIGAFARWLQDEFGLASPALPPG